MGGYEILIHQTAIIGLATTTHTGETVRGVRGCRKIDSMLDLDYHCHTRHVQTCSLSSRTTCFPFTTLRLRHFRVTQFHRLTGTRRRGRLGCEHCHWLKHRCPCRPGVLVGENWSSPYWFPRNVGFSAVMFREERLSRTLLGQFHIPPKKSCRQFDVAI